MDLSRTHRCNRHPRTQAIVSLLSRRMTCLALASVAVLLSARAVHAVPMEGRVRNGTTGQPAAGITVHLVKLQQGMTPVESVTADAQGVFRIETDALGGAPGLIQVEYQGATYSQPLMSPQTMSGGLNIQVYDATSDRSGISIPEHAIFLRPSGGEMAVIEQVAISNTSNPPRTYVNREGTYLFALPGEPRDGLVASIEGAAGMPVPLSPAERSAPNSFAIAYPIRPGESQIRLQYTLAYQSPFRFTKPLEHAGEQTHIVTPGEGVELTGDALEPLGKEPTTGFMAYLVKSAGRAEFDVKGEVVVTEAEAAQAAGSSGTLTQISDPVTQRIWLVLGGLGLIMLAGYWYLSTRSA